MNYLPDENYGIDFIKTAMFKMFIFGYKKQKNMKKFKRSEFIIEAKNIVEKYLKEKGLKNVICKN